MSQERGFRAALASRVSTELSPGVIPAVIQLVLPAHLDEWGGGGKHKVLLSHTGGVHECLWCHLTPVLLCSWAVDNIRCFSGTENLELLQNVCLLYQEKEQCMLAGLRRGGGRNRGVHFNILGQCDTSKTSQCIFSGRKGLSHLWTYSYIICKGTELFLVVVHVSAVFQIAQSFSLNSSLGLWDAPKSLNDPLPSYGWWMQQEIEELLKQNLSVVNWDIPSEDNCIFIWRQVSDFWSQVCMLVR